MQQKIRLPREISQAINASNKKYIKMPPFKTSYKKAFCNNFLTI